jgi:hypothetical protein
MVELAGRPNRGDPQKNIRPDPGIAVALVGQAIKLARHEALIFGMGPSILATIREWLNIPRDKMLPSARIKAAPGFGNALSLTTPRTDRR